MSADPPSQRQQQADVGGKHDVEGPVEDDGAPCGPCSEEEQAADEAEDHGGEGRPEGRLQGVVEDLKEKYVLVKGEKEDADAAKDILFSFSSSQYGFEGVCLSENLDKLAGMDITVERPSLYQISVAVMKAYSRIKLNKR